MKLDARAILAIAVMVIIGFGAYSIAFAASLPYGGGGEIGDTISRVDVRGGGLSQTWYPTGQHEWPNVDQQNDLDGNFEDYVWTYGTADSDGDGKKDLNDEDIQLPGVKISVGYPYYLEYKGLYEGDPLYVQSEEAVVEKEYEKTYTFNNESRAYHYELLNYGFDVTIRTDADAYDKTIGQWGVLQDWGWYYEAKVVESWVRANFGLTPWVPKGAWNESYTAIGGWAGIIQAQPYDIDFGVFENQALEDEMEELEDSDVIVRETGITIDALQIRFSALNMYLPVSGDAYQEIDFEDPDAIAGVKNAVNIEMGAKLGAGAAYITETLTHWTNIAVQNVYVTYRVVVKLVTTVNLRLITEGDPVATPAGGSTTGDPPPVPIYSTLAEMWGEFWADVAEFFMSPIGILYTIIILVIIAGVVYFVIRMFGRRG